MLDFNITIICKGTVDADTYALVNKLTDELRAKGVVVTHAGLNTVLPLSAE